jgi:glycosyltransferase involved in cell wall biosynthesis
LFRKSLERHKIEIVLAEYGPTGAEVCDTCKALGIPLIVHFHGFDASRKTLLDQYSDGYKRLFEYASHVVVVSQQMKNDIHQLGCTSDKIVLNIYGGYPVFFQVSPNFQSKRFLCVGRFVEKKAPHLTILAFFEYLKRGNDALLTMIGDGPLKGSCLVLAKALKIAHKIEFKGVLSPKEVASVFSQSICFLQHSVTAESGETEGTPVSAIEALASGLPLIVTKHAGLIDMVINSQGGFLVDELDYMDMANKMEYVMNNIEEAKKLGEAGRKYTLEHLSLEHSLETINSLISKV